MHTIDLRSGAVPGAGFRVVLQKVHASRTARRRAPNGLFEIFPRNERKRPKINRNRPPGPPPIEGPETAADDAGARVEATDRHALDARHLSRLVGDAGRQLIGVSAEGRQFLLDDATLIGLVGRRSPSIISIGGEPVVLGDQLLNAAALTLPIILKGLDLGRRPAGVARAPKVIDD